MSAVSGDRIALVETGETADALRGEALAAPRIAVLVPCHNEAASIVSVISDMQAALPNARIHVYDNASTDNTAELARQAGALVGSEPLKGKGNVVRRMFADVDADIYVLVDGDATYDAAAAPAMVKHLIDNNLDMVTGTRETTVEEAYRPGHRSGNAVLTGLVTRLFGRPITDMLSGYRVMSRRFVKSFPVLSQGFEIETELTIHANELKLPVDEMPTAYGARGEESASKLNTIRDGFRILGTIVMLLYSERPVLFFGAIAAVAAILSLALAIPVIVTFVETGLVPRFPTAILSMVLGLVALLCLVCGLILKTVTKGRQEMKRLAYLQTPSVKESCSVHFKANTKKVQKNI